MTNTVWLWCLLHYERGVILLSKSRLLVLRDDKKWRDRVIQSSSLVANFIRVEARPVGIKFILIHFRWSLVSYYIMATSRKCAINSGQVDLIRDTMAGNKGNYFSLQNVECAYIERETSLKYQKIRLEIPQTFMFCYPEIYLNLCLLKLTNLLSFSENICFNFVSFPWWR